MFEMLIT